MKKTGKYAKSEFPLIAGLRFYICLASFVYRDGFVTGITFTIHSWIVYFIDVLIFLGKLAFEPGLLFLRRRVFFRTCQFSLFLSNPYTRMCVSTMGSLSCFYRKMKKHRKIQVASGCFGFCLTFDLSVFYYTGNNFGDPPSPPQCLPSW